MHNVVVNQAEDIVHWDKGPGRDKLWAQRIKDYEQYLSAIQRDVTKLYPACRRITRPFTLSPFRKAAKSPAFVDMFRVRFLAWYQTQQVTPTLLSETVNTTMTRFMLQHKEIVAVLKAVHTTAHPGQPGHQLAMDTLDLCITLIAALGISNNLYPLWEAKHILLLANLTEPERAVLAAAFLLPIADRLFRAGRIMYTPSRLGNVYGGEPEAWKKTVACADKLLQNQEAWRTLADAAETIRLKGKLPNRAHSDVVARLPVLTAQKLGLSTPSYQEPEGMVRTLWGKLSTTFPWIERSPAYLDQHAVRRILSFGPDVPQLQCQLQSELAESFLGALLRHKLGKYVLDIALPPGCMLEFVPGHGISVPYDPSKMRSPQVTDGVLCYFLNGIFYIAAILEIKVQGLGCREFRFSKVKLEALTRQERITLRASAAREWARLVEVSEKTGSKFQNEVDDFLPQMLASETGDRVTRDLDRLLNFTELQIHGSKTRVELLQDPSKQTTKFIAVMPRKGDFAALKKTVDDENKQRGTTFEFEPLALPFDADELERLCASMTDAANRLAFPPPTTPGTSPTDFITYIERLYTLATAYLSTPGSHEVKSPNKAVMQWLRHKEYAGPGFQRTLGNLDAQWTAHVTKSGLTMIDWVADPLQPVSIKVSHFGAALDGVTLESKMQILANILDSRLNISDLLGWAGDLITFYVDWQVAARASKTKLAGDDFCLERLAQPAYKKIFDTTAKLRDFVEDVDAYNIGMALMADPKRTIVQEVKELFRPAGGYTKQFQRFWKARLGGSVKTAADLANHLLSTDSLVDGIAYARERIIAGEERNRKISPPIVRPEAALGASTRMEFCEGFAQVMEQLAAFG